MTCMSKGAAGLEAGGSLEEEGAQGVSVSGVLAAPSCIPSVGSTGSSRTESARGSVANGDGELEVLQKIYMKMLQIIFGYRMEYFYMMPVNIDIQYFNIYEGFLPIANLLTAMEQFMPMCRVYDFQLSDLISPKGKRVNYCLSGALNFLVFRNDQRERFIQWSNSYRSALDNLQQLQKSNYELEEKIQKLKTVPPEQQAEFNELSSEINDLNHILQKHRVEDETLKETFSQMKAEYAAQAQRLSDEKLTLANLKEEVERMKSQIVESPEARKSKTANMKATVQKLKMEREETNKKCQYYRERVAVGSLWKSEVQLYHKKLTGLRNNMDQKTKVCTEITNAEDQAASGNAELKKLSAEEAKVKRNLNLKKEKLVKLDMKIKKNQEDNELHKQTLIEACKHISEKREAVHATLNQKECGTQQIRLQTKKLLEAFEEQKNEVQSIITGFKTGLDKYHDFLTRVKEEAAANRTKKIDELKRQIQRRC